MKYTPIILALSLLLTSCSALDSTHHKQVAGVWNYDELLAMTISPDGSFSMIPVKSKPSLRNTFAGTWQLQGHTFILTFTNTPGITGPAVGGVERCKIIHLDDHQFIYREESNGSTHTLSR